MLIFALFLILLILHSKFDLFHRKSWDGLQELSLEYVEYFIFKKAFILPLDIICVLIYS